MIVEVEIMSNIHRPARLRLQYMNGYDESQKEVCVKFVQVCSSEDVSGSTVNLEGKHDSVSKQLH